MLQLNSERLSLLALSHQQLLLLLKSRHQLEISLELNVSDFKLNTSDSFMDEFVMALHSFVIPMVAQNRDSAIWYTHWLIIDKRTKLTVGGIGAAGLPNAEGEVMIGYFVDGKHEGVGYATEAVICFSEWIREYAAVKSIIADTLIDNMASQQVLKKAGFYLDGITPEGLRWRLLNT